MKKSVWVLVIVLVLGALVLSACGGGGGGTTRQDPPEEFASMTNPFAGDQAAIDAGRELYVTNCAGCHGDSAEGNGPAAASLDPQPANLVTTAKEADAPYIHWVISQGGAAAGLSSSMVGYDGILSEDQIWQVTSYIESLE